MSSICKRLRSMKLDKSCDDKIFDSDEDDDVRKSIRKMTNGRKLSRGEMSRLAAKVRRDKEAVEFTCLTDLLPFSRETISKLDKNSIVRLIISYMRMKHYMQEEMAGQATKSTLNDMISVCDNGDTLAPTDTPNGHKTTPDNGLALDKTSPLVEEGKLMLEAMNGFIILLDRKKIIMYISENVEAYLGLKQEQMVGQNIKDFINPSDKPQLRKQFNLQLRNPGHKDSSAMDVDNEAPDLDDERVFYLRMKFNLQKPGTKIKQSGYTLVQWKGRLKMKPGHKPNSYMISGLLCVCRPMQTSSILEIRMDGNMFMSRHDMAMTFTFCDPRIITLVGYEPSELIGKTAYQFHNPLDAEKVGNCHSNLIVKGTSVSKYYRFLGKNCEWVWMQTRATIIYNTSNVPQYVVCMNYIISEEEGERYLSMEQEQDGSHFSHFTGVMDLSATHAKPVIMDSSVTQEVPDDHCSDHSDAGYGSSYSPYSSRHSGGSPCSIDSGNAKDVRSTTRLTDDEETNMSVDAGESEFPMFLQEVTKTMNSDVPNDRDVLDFLESLDKDNMQTGALPNEPLPDVQQFLSDVQTTEHWNTGSSQSCLQLLLTDGLTNSTVSPDPVSTVPQTFSGTSSTVAAAQPAVALPPSYTTSGYNGYVNSPITTIADSPVMASPSGNRNTSNFGNAGVDNCQGTPVADYFSDSNSQGFAFSDSNMRTLTGSDRPRNGDAIGHGTVNVSVNALDQTYFSGLNGDSLPKEISDFCMQYTNTLADNQAYALMSEYMNGGCTDLNNLSQNPSSLPQSTVTGHIAPPNGFSNSIPRSSAGANQLKNSNMQRSSGRSHIATPTVSAARKRPNSISNKSSGVGGTPRPGSMTCQALLQLQKQKRQQQQLLQQKQQQQQQQQQQQALLQNIQHIVLQNHQQPPRVPGSLLQQQTQVSRSNAMPQHLQGQYFVPPSTTCTSPSTACNNFSSRTLNGVHSSDSQNCVLTNSINSLSDSAPPNFQTMSELEKMLRGYTSPTRTCDNNGVTNFQQCVINTNSINSNNSATLLEKMLTGELSGAQYHALEKQRVVSGIPNTRN